MRRTVFRRVCISSCTTSYFQPCPVRASLSPRRHLPARSVKRQIVTMASEKDVKVIGGADNFWLYSKAEGYDLTHPPTPTSERIYPRIPLKTTKGPIAIDASKTALVIVDLQNYFLSPVLGRPPDGPGIKAVQKLLKYAIPACRKASIPIVWLNWGLTDEDIDGMPPAIVMGNSADENYDDDDRDINDFGNNIGPVTLEDGTVVEGGRVLMLDQWNTRSYTPLEEKYEPQDMRVNKDRLSGFWGGTGIEDMLRSHGLRTLLFAGANLDQCVATSLVDAMLKGWDCLLLSDGTATTSPDFTRKAVEYNTEGGWGFVLTCEDLANGIDDEQRKPTVSL